MWKSRTPGPLTNTPLPHIISQFIPTPPLPQSPKHSPSTHPRDMNLQCVICRHSRAGVYHVSGLHTSTPTDPHQHLTVQPQESQKASCLPTELSRTSLGEQHIGAPRTHQGACFLVCGKPQAQSCSPASPALETSSTTLAELTCCSPAEQSLRAHWDS